MGKIKQIQPGPKESKIKFRTQTKKKGNNANVWKIFDIIKIFKKYIHICILIVILLISLIVSRLSRKNNLFNNNNNKDFITFIIPTIGRKTLVRTIDSLKAQTENNWNAIIIFDGINPTIQSDDPRIKIIKIKKTGKDINSAGGVRNVGLKMVKSEWVGFVDDDDTLSNNYVKYLMQDSEKYNTAKVIIFRMQALKGNILPAPEDTNFYVDKIGISFAVKTNYYKKNNLYFTPSSKEDYTYLDSIRSKGAPILISSNVGYFVEHKQLNTKKYDEVLIN